MKIFETDRVKILINISTFLENFQKAKSLLKRLKKDFTNASVKQKLNKINNLLKEINQKHKYSEK